jgi:chromosome segregation ATPase
MTDNTTESISDSEYTSVRFGVNRFQKKNKELEKENDMYKELNSKLKQELDNTKELYNTAVVSLNSKNSEIGLWTEKWNEKYDKKSVELENTIEKYNETKEKLERVEETNNSLCSDINIYKEQCIKSETENKEMLNKYNEVKQRNIELKELCNIKSTMNMNTDITIAELSSQINIKNEYLEKAKIEVNEAKRAMIEYRESNKILRNKLEDKDAYIVKLNGEMGDLCYRLENSTIQNTVVNEKSEGSKSTPRVTTYKENTQLQVGVQGVSGTARRAVQSHRRV